VKKLTMLKVDPMVVKISSRRINLYPHPPPGSKDIVSKR
jgi:hypothetical protein